MTSGMGPFHAETAEGYAGVCDLPGKSEKQIALITTSGRGTRGQRMDRRPVLLTLRDGFAAVGRGTADDRGRPSSHCLPQKFLKDNKA